jgi:hypothetical protein
VKKQSEVGPETFESLDLDLMLYLDGELEDAARVAAVEAYLARAQGRTKSKSLRIASDLVRAHAAAPSKLADGIADDVMAAIAKETASKPSTETVKGASKESATTRVSRAPDALRGSTPPANDNGRGIYILAAFAAAAAFALFFWGRGSFDSSSTTQAPVAVLSDKPVSPAAPIAAVEPIELVAAATPHGIELAAVDFGANSGTIINDDTTMVVWVHESAEQ